MNTTLGDKVRSLRKERKLTLEQLAKLTGSSKSYICEIENKILTVPSARKLFRIANALGVTTEYLLDEGEELRQEEAVDARFYRKYQKMDPKTKAKLRNLVDIWDDTE